MDGEGAPAKRRREGRDQPEKYIPQEEPHVENQSRAPEGTHKGIRRDKPASAIHHAQQGSGTGLATPVMGALAQGFSSALACFCTFLSQESRHAR